jgi:hypothetical protein
MRQHPACPAIDVSGRRPASSRMLPLRRPVAPHRIGRNQELSFRKQSSASGHSDSLHGFSAFRRIPLRLPQELLKLLFDYSGIKSGYLERTALTG